MKNFRLLPFLFALPLLCTAFLPADNVMGGDVFEVYLNGSRIHQQFVRADKSTKAIRLSTFNDNDKVDVYYSHCGYPGKSRVLTLRNEKGEKVKEIKFADAAGPRSLMGFTCKDIGKLASQKLNLYYRAKEMPDGKLLAVIIWDGNQNMAKR